MSAKSLNAAAGIEAGPVLPPPLPSAETEAAPGPYQEVKQNFVRGVAIFIGMLLGAILAVIVALSTGWIEIKC